LRWKNAIVGVRVKNETPFHAITAFTDTKDCSNVRQTPIISDGSESHPVCEGFASEALLLRARAKKGGVS
jgi:hypothetical protein